MDAHPLVVRPRLDARHGHQLVDADGRVVAGLEVAPSRDTGAIVVDGRRWSVRRPPTGRDWTVTVSAGGSPASNTPDGGGSSGIGSAGDPVATITKPSAVRERFELALAVERFTIEPRGPIGRRRWVVTAAGVPMMEVTQGLVRRRWHELRSAGTPPERGDRLATGGIGLEPPLTLVVAFVVALVDTTPPTGLSGLRRARG
jgi:hypothetical protein